MSEVSKKWQLRINTEALVDHRMSLAKSMESHLLNFGKLKESIIDKECRYICLHLMKSTT